MFVFCTDCGDRKKEILLIIDFERVKARKMRQILLTIQSRDVSFI